MPEFPMLKISPPGQFVEVDGETLFLGRDCHLAAFIPSMLSKVVSNRHCVVRKEVGGRWMLEDLGSTNGTWLRGTRLFGKVLLHTGDIFNLGKQGPACECTSGFGGTGPDATIAEDERHRMAAAPTLLDNYTPPVAAGRDGTIDRPFRVGKTPELVLFHNGTGRELRASGYTVVIGRDPAAAQIVLRSDEEKHISGRHLEIQFRSDGTVVARDLDSRNGSWLNDRPIKGEMPIRPGDKLVLGAAYTTLKVVQLEANA